jgi:hypothetical protein
VRREKPPSRRGRARTDCRRLSTSCPSTPTRHCISHPLPTVMSAFRIARSAALKVRPSAFRAPSALLRRGYADVASDKIQLSLVLPHQVRSQNTCLLSRPDAIGVCAFNWLEQEANNSVTGHIQERRCVRTSSLRSTPCNCLTDRCFLSTAYKSTSPLRPERWVSSPSTSPRLSN